MDDEFDFLAEDSFDETEYDYVPYTCQHGREDDCDECDTILDECGGVDKCLNCGRYKAGIQLTKDQVCAKGCTNPAEY